MLATLPAEERPEVPELWAWVEAPWRAWQELSADRQFTVGGYGVPMGGTMITSAPGPIPWTALQAWCDRTGCDQDEREQFILPLVAALDREYIAHWHKQQQQQSRHQPQSSEDKLSRWERAK